MVLCIYCIVILLVGQCPVCDGQLRLQCQLGGSLLSIWTLSFSSKPKAVSEKESSYQQVMAGHCLQSPNRRFCSTCRDLPKTLKWHAVCYCDTLGTAGSPRGKGSMYSSMLQIFILLWDSLILNIYYSTFIYSLPNQRGKQEGASQPTLALKIPKQASDWPAWNLCLPFITLSWEQSSTVCSNAINGT